MSARARWCAAVSLVLLLVLTREASADGPIHVYTEAPRELCKTEGDPPVRECRELPPGHFVDEATWAAIDAEMRRLQDQEVRLTAENKSFRTSAAEGSGWRPGWITLVTAFALGTAAGWYAYRTWE